jgi:two-component system response regulator
VPNKTILLIEDNSDDEALTIHAIRAGRVANPIVVAKDGVEALDYLLARGLYSGRDASQLPAIALLDINLPRIDGLEVLRQIRANDLTRLLPVVILTSSREDQDLVRAYELGANSYVRKPVNFEHLKESVRQLTLYWLQVNECPPTSLSVER